MWNGHNKGLYRRAKERKQRNKKQCGRVMTTGNIRKEGKTKHQESLNVEI